MPDSRPAFAIGRARRLASLAASLQSPEMLAPRTTLPTGRPGDAKADQEGRAGPGTRSEPEWENREGLLLDGVPALLDVGRDVSGGLAADQVDHSGPEGAGADLARHQVRPVEAEGRGVDENLALFPQLVVGVGLGIGRLERREQAGLGHPDFVGERHLEEVDELARRLRILGDRDQRTGAQNGSAEFRLGGKGRQIEEVGVLAQLGAFREEGGDERCLAMQVAFRRDAEEPLGAVAEVGRGDRRPASVNEFVVGGDVGEDLQRR